MQVFSPDSVLQLVPHAAIPLLLQYSTSGVVNERLPSLIPALGIIFINTPTECTDSPDLRKLSRILAERAKLTFNDLVNNRDIIRNTNECPPYSSREWEETGSFYGRPPIRYRQNRRYLTSSKKMIESAMGKSKNLTLTWSKSQVRTDLLAWPLAMANGRSGDLNKYI
jgi:hypothetical protein